MKRSSNPWGILALLIFTFIATALQGQAPLEVSINIDARIAAGQAHEYRISLRADDYAKVTFDQRSVAVSVTVLAPDGNPLFTASYDSPGEAASTDFIAAAAGVYRLKVTAAERNSPGGITGLL